MLRLSLCFLLLSLGSCHLQTRPKDEKMSLEQLKDMIRALEERKKSLTQTNSTQRRLELTGTGAATCSFDLIGTVLAVARAGTVLYFVQDSCKDTETINQKTACSATILGLFSTIGFLISFLSDSIAMCQATVNVPATCAAVSGNLIAILGIMGGAISGLENSCRAATIENESPPDWVQELFPDVATRRLSHSHEFKDLGNHSLARLPPVPTRGILSEEAIQEIRNKLSADEFRRVEIAQCVFDTTLTSMFFGRGLLDIYNAAMTNPCTADPETFDGHTLDVTSSCLVSVTGMITTFDFVASLIALLVSECPEGANVKALCAADCTILVGAVSGLLQTGTSFLLVCGELDDHVDEIIDTIGTDIAI